MPSTGVLSVSWKQKKTIIYISHNFEDALKHQLKLNLVFPLLYANSACSMEHTVQSKKKDNI